jgi:hypothetical protein
MNAATPAARAPHSLKSTFAWAAVLVFVDAFLVNQGGLAALAGLWTLFVSLPRAAFATDRSQRRPRFARAGVWFGAVLLVFGLNWVNNQIARSRADALVAAIKAFHQNNNRYPAKLAELVPGFIKQIPAAKYTFGQSAFTYVATADYHGLSYVAIPPFGRPTYSFEKDRWGYRD